MKKANLDSLNSQSMEFYERANLKLSVTLIFSSFALFFLGLAAQYGGMCSYEQFIINYNSNNNAAVNDDHINASSANLASGYAFGCFFLTIASVMSFCIAIYYSPFLSSRNEAKTITNPQDIEFRPPAEAKQEIPRI